MGLKNICASLLAIGVAAGLASGAWAEASAAAGTASGISGHVTVVRGSKTFSLKDGDQIFDGDRILTGSDGLVTVTTPTCARSLQNSQSISVDTEVCTKSIVALSEADMKLAQAGGGGIGATPALLGGAAAVGGGAAAAGGGGGGGSPASP